MLEGSLALWAFSLGALTTGTDEGARQLVEPPVAKHAIRGRLVDREGLGVTGGRVHVTCPASEEGATWTITGADGRFETEPLPAGMYEVRAGTSLERALHDPEPVTASAPTRGETLLLSIDAPRIEVAVRERNGDYSSAEEETFVFLLEVSEPHDRDRLRGVRGGDWTSFPAVPGREYFAVWDAGFGRYAEARVRVSEHVDRTRVVLDMPDEDLTAELVLRSHDAAGRCYAMGLNGYDSDPAVSLYSSAGNRIASSNDGRWSEIHDGRWRVHVPPGNYRVVVESGHVDAPFRSSCFFDGEPEPTPEAPRQPFVRTERALSLEPGEVRFENVLMNSGGYLDIVSSEFEPDHGGVSIEDLEGALFEVVGAHGVRRQSLDVLRVGGASDPVALRGLTAIPPGVWTLRITWTEAVLLERSVAIHAGEVARFDW